MMNRLSSPATFALALLMTLPMACGDDGGGDGNPGGIDGGGNVTVDANPDAPRTVFRLDDIKLLDPHVFTTGSFRLDVTSQVNNQIRDAATQDADDPADGILDLNVSMVFRPLDQAGSSTPLTISFAECTSPVASTVCTQGAATTLISATATNDTGSPCLDVLPDTVLPYSPAVIPVPTPCFTSNEVDVTVNLGTVTLPLKSATIAATYSGDPATSLVTGVLRGYVTTADANGVIIPEDVAVVGGKMLSELLKEEDKDADPSGAPDNNGWWFYLSIEASEVTYVVE